jgi:transcriptional regulator with XRE-family HTH domain
MTGKQLRDIRLKMGLSQKNFGAMIGLRQNSVYRLENNIHPIRPSIEKLVKMLEQAE